MKKLMTALVLALAVGAASASTINWGNGPGYITDDGGATYPNSGTAYLVYVGADGWDSTFDGTSWTMGDDDIIVASSPVGTAGGFSSGSFFQATTVTDPVYDKVGSQYVIIYTTAGVAGNEMPTTGFYGVSGVFTQTFQGEVSFPNEFGLPTDLGYPIEIIPEPSTYALALIGVAAVALRRKFMKK